MGHSSIELVTEQTFEGLQFDMKPCFEQKIMGELKGGEVSQLYAVYILYSQIYDIQACIHIRHFDMLYYALYMCNSSYNARRGVQLENKKKKHYLLESNASKANE